MRLKLFTPIEALRRRERKRERRSFSSTGKWPLSLGTRIGGDGGTVAGFLTTQPKMEGKFLLVEIKVPLGRRKNGKATSLVTIGSNGHKCGLRSGKEDVFI